MIDKLNYATALLLSLSFLPWDNGPHWARVSSISRLHDHSQTHHIR